MSNGRAARGAQYASYMASPAWWARRRRWYREASADGEPACIGCDQQWTLDDDMHHVTYERLGDESHDDLWPMCRECHDFVHTILGRPGWARVGRRQAHRIALRGLRDRAKQQRSER